MNSTTLVRITTTLIATACLAVTGCNKQGQETSNPGEEFEASAENAADGFEETADEVSSEIEDIDDDGDDNLGEAAEDLDDDGDDNL